MRYLLFTLCTWLLTINLTFSQSATLKGVVKDGSTGDPLDNASVVILPVNGVFTDITGKYELKAEPGEVTLVTSYIGMKADTQLLKLKAGEIRTLNITLGSNPYELQQVVIGENKIGVKVQKVTQSVDIMKPRLLEANNITNMQGALTKMPGVTILDGQMSVRGGSGYAYGSGSRVLLVIDEMPLMSADRSDIEWHFIPIENVEQLELLKGASSMQYGASALNGVINVTTAYARDTPTTRMTFFYEGIAKPPVDSFQWWKRDGRFLNSPNTAGMSFIHKHKFGGVDFILGGMLQGSQSHLNEEQDHFTRFNTKLRWQPKKLQRLTLELSANMMYRKSGFQFWWANSSTPYVSASGVSIDERYFYAYIDPKFKYIDKKNNVHKLYTRIYRQNNMDGETDFWIYTVDYQFRHDFGKIFRILAGVRNEHWIVNDGTLGKHKADFGGGFLLGELNYKWLSMNLGIREEYVRLDSAFTPTIPLIKAGVNFEIRKYNYIRASFGQSFRVPSIAERFVRYELAGIQIIPNQSIRPERGFTAELGYKRSIKIGNWLGYTDVAMFWTEFKDMVEFQFDIAIDNSKTPPAIVPYFQSQNVSKARIFGWEISAYGEGKMGPVDMTMLLGYTYFYGVDLNDTSVTHNVGDFLGDAFRKFVMPTPKSEPSNPAQDYEVWDSLTAGMLKYRNPHTLKADFDFILYNRYHLGTSLQYYSFMTNIDNIFEVAIPGAKEVRQSRLNKGDVTWDLRAGYDFNPNVTLNFLVKNVMNANYAIRPAKPERPRSYTVQLVVNLSGNTAKAVRNPQVRPGVI